MWGLYTFEQILEGHSKDSDYLALRRDWWRKEVLFRKPLYELHGSVGNF